MRPEIDYTRQRTVAELLAEHGEAGPGRRRRRQGDGPPPGGPPGPPQGPPPRYPPDAGPARPMHDPGPQTVAGRDPGYRGAPPVPPRPAPVRRDRPTGVIADRPPTGRPGTAGYGPGTPRGGAPSNGAGPSSASGPMRVVPPGGREVPGRATASGPLRAVPTAGAGAPDVAPPSNGRAGASGPMRPVAPSPAANPWEPQRATPAGGPGRSRPATAWGGPPTTAAPVREQAGPSALREPVGRPYLPAATPQPAPHRPSAVPSRGQQHPGPPVRPVPDSGPATGAWDPFEFDDEDDDGPHTVVDGADARRRGPTAVPRQDPYTVRGDGPATEFDLGSRRGARPDPARPTDGPATDFDVTALRRDGGATDLDVTGRSGLADGPATEFDVTSGQRPAPGRPQFGAGSRVRSGRTAAAPLVTPPAARPTSPPPRVRPFAGDVVGSVVVDEPTELTDRGARPDVLDDEDDDLQDADAFAGNGFFADGFSGDRLDQDDEHLQDRDLVRGHDDADLDEGDLDDRAHDDYDAHDDPDLDLDDHPEREGARPAQAWAGVVAQWLAGAVAGAVLWVLFRFLWRELPVVALAAAVLVTAGLVLLVRQLLHHVDRRTTGFAVLVGLLLTASPAVLVLLGR